MLWSRGGRRCPHRFDHTCGIRTGREPQERPDTRGAAADSLDWREPNTLMREDPIAYKGVGLRLVAIRIENHSRLAKLSLEVRQHLVLVGSNDVGKSSLLRCLDLVLGASTAALYSRITKEDFADPAQAFVVEIDLADFTPDEKAAFPDEILISNGIPDTLTVRLEASLDEGETLQISRYAPHSGAARQLSRVQIEALGWKMVGATQTGARDFRDDRNSSLQDILEAIELGEEEQLFRQVVDGFQGRLNASAVLLQLREQLATQLSRAVPEQIEPGELEFVTGSIAEDDLLADVRLQVTRGGVSRSMTEQSDGARALFAIAMYDLVSSAANMVAIDEPEIHLHPTSQRSLARLLRRSTNQKVIATHSPDIVGSFEPEHIVVIRKGGQAVQPSSGFLDGEAKLAAHWWVRDKLEPLTSKQVILVEGVSDRIVLQRAAELFDKDLDRLGVSVIETDGGNEIPNARKIFGPNGFQIKLLMLIDDDARVRTAEKLCVQETELAQHGVVISTPDLEGEYASAIGASELWRRLEHSGEFTPNQLSNCASSGPNGSRTEEDVAAFCRHKRYKVQASLIVASSITQQEAARLSSITELLEGVALAS